MLVLLAACNSTAAPAPHQPAPVSPPATLTAAAPVDAAPLRPTRSPDFGPVIGDIETLMALAPQDHEVNFWLWSGSRRRSVDRQITISDADPANIVVTDDPRAPSRMWAGDATWGVEENRVTDTIVAGPIVDGKLVEPVVVYGASARIRYLGASEDQRTIVLQVGDTWIVERSHDHGATWVATRIAVASTFLFTSRRSLDAISRDGQWFRIDQRGDVIAMRVDTLHLASLDWFSNCASRTLPCWVAVAIPSEVRSAKSPRASPSGAGRRPARQRRTSGRHGGLERRANLDRARGKASGCISLRRPERPNRAG